MCELCPQWLLTKDLTRKQDDHRETSYNSGLKEEVGKTIDQHDKCRHYSISRLQNGNFYCNQCQHELKLTEMLDKIP